MRLLLRLILNRYVLSLLVLTVLLFDFKVISLYQSEFSIITFDETPEVEPYAYYELPLDMFDIHWIKVTIHEGFIHHQPIIEELVDESLISNPVFSPLHYLIAFLVAWLFPFKWFINLGKNKQKKESKPTKKHARA